MSEIKLKFRNECPVHWCLLYNGSCLMCEAKISHSKMLEGRGVKPINTPVGRKE